ncbi:arylalkylamine N-acetyltransferase 1 [Drosophila sulfurigaster albostrigata]|uniref:aralkylamine N-acetyltransferase n=1 Tax=Drosophila albomicans TaxID=7291 RepID=A0A6P8WL47_DROAB|nr:arylalkylamine N-acetyltransferase 1 [Drosophila albomicans]XP_062139276.1 arylalkylamine N-acetyltransferase 1 [Drosophila sulfurigaster albostrigata]
MEYKLISGDYYERVIDHLRGNFFADEPLNRAAGLCQQGGGNRELEHHSLATLQDQLSIMAVDERKDSVNYGQIAGVILNGVLRSGDTEQALDKLQFSCDSNYKKIFELLYRHSLQVDLFARYNVQRIFDVRILSVDSRYRGQGIAKELVRRAEQVARESGYHLLKADATGIFSQKILRSQGFEAFSEQLYAKYRDDEGRIILPVEAPHIKLQLLTKELKYENDH